LLTHDPVTQSAMIEALADREGPRELTRVYRARAEYAFERLTAVGCRAVRAEGGFYVVLDCTDWLKAGRAGERIALARDLRARAQVATVPATAFGAPPPLRVSLRSGRFEAAIDRLADHFTAPPRAAVRARPPSEAAAGRGA